MSPKLIGALPYRNQKKKFLAFRIIHFDPIRSMDNYLAKRLNLIIPNATSNFLPIPLPRLSELRSD